MMVYLFIVSLGITSPSFYSVVYLKSLPVCLCNCLLVNLSLQSIYLFGDLHVSSCTSAILSRIVCQGIPYMPRYTQGGCFEKKFCSPATRNQCHVDHTSSSPLWMRTSHSHVLKNVRFPRDFRRCPRTFKNQSCKIRVCFLTSGEEASSHHIGAMLFLSRLQKVIQGPCASTLF